MDSIYLAYKNGLLDKAIELETIKPAVMDYLRFYQAYLQFVAIGHGYTEAVRLAAECANTSESTIKRAIAAVI